MIGTRDGEAIVVDVHAHLGPSPSGEDRRVSRLIEAMDVTGVDHSCVFASATRGDAYLGETLLILEAASESQGRIIPFARVHPFWRADAVRELRQVVGAGVRGLKLHPFMDGAFAANDKTLIHPLMGVAAEAGLVVLVHSGWGWNSAPGLVADLARSFPDVNVIMGHAGRYGYHREAAAVGRDVPNLYFDVAGLSTPGAVEELVRSVGPTRVLFGSDHPYSPLGFELEKTARWTDLQWEDVVQLVGGNAARLLSIDPGSGRAPRREVPQGLLAEGGSE
jgi:predicted TIM-barrel fold metal-dependent hydrolase